MRHPRLAPLALTLLLLACGDDAAVDEPPVDASPPDAGVDAGRATGDDAGPPDAGAPDAAVATDAGAEDGGRADAGEADAGPLDGGPPDLHDGGVWDGDLSAPDGAIPDGAVSDGAAADGAPADAASTSCTRTPTLTCVASGGAASTHLGRCGGTRELHIVGGYEPADGPGGTIEVDVTADRAPVVLLLVAYEATDWVVTAASGVTIDHILVDGWDASTVDAPAGVPVTNTSGTGAGVSSACIIAWPDDEDGCDTPGAVDYGEDEAGVTLSTFGACYSLEAATVR